MVAELCCKGEGGGGVSSLKGMNADELEGNPEKVTLLYARGQVPSDVLILLCGRQCREPAGSQQHHTALGGPSELNLKARWATHSALSAHKSHRIP